MTASTEVVPVGVDAAPEPGVVTVGMLTTLGLSVSEPETRALVNLCRLYRLDPLAKHVQVIETSNGPRVYVTVHGYREIAEQSGELLGMTETETYEGESGYRVRVRVDRALKAGRASFEFAGGCGRAERQAKAGKGLAMARTRAVRQALRWAFPLRVHYDTAQYVVNVDELDDDPAGYDDPVEVEVVSPDTGEVTAFVNPQGKTVVTDVPSPTVGSPSGSDATAAARPSDVTYPATSPPTKAPTIVEQGEKARAARQAAGRRALGERSIEAQAQFLARYDLPNARDLPPDALDELLEA